MSVFKDGETLHVGPIAITAHLTPGHTPGGTTWTWDSCEKERCMHMVYADSLSTASSPGFKFSEQPDEPEHLKDFESSFAKVGALPCECSCPCIPNFPICGIAWRSATSAHDPNGLIDSHACEKSRARCREHGQERVAEGARK